MSKLLPRCRLNIVDLRSGIPKTNEQIVYFNTCPIVIPIAYPFGLAFDSSKGFDTIDITAINVELERESLVCTLHLSNTCNAILFVVLTQSKLEEELVDCLYVHLCEVESCRGLANVAYTAPVPQTS